MSFVTAGADGAVPRTSDVQPADIAAARDGASRELGELLERYRPYLLAIAMQEMPEALGGKVGASDVVQESLLKGCEQFGTFQGSTAEELSGWLRKILVNQLVNVARSYGTLKRRVDRECRSDSRLADLNQLSPSGEAVSREEWDRVQAALGRLPEHYREVVLLRHRDNLSFGEIGKLLNKSDEAVRKLWARAIQQLQDDVCDE